jgi:hypothetical protein
MLLTFKDGIWNVEDDIEVTEFVNLNGVLYGLTEDGIKNMVDPDGDESVSWSLTTKWFNFDNAGSTKSVKAVHVVCDVPTGGSMTVYISGGAKGSEWTQIGTITADSDIQNEKIMLPANVAYKEDWFKLKFSGTGICSIHAFEVHVRLKAPNY